MIMITATQPPAAIAAPKALTPAIIAFIAAITALIAIFVVLTAA